MSPNRNTVPPTMTHPLAFRFWLAVLLIGASTGTGAVGLTRLLEAVQSLVWGGSGTALLENARNVPGWHVVLVLVLAGIATGAGQVILKRLSSANGIDTATAIWFHAGRLPAVRTLGSAVLSVIIVAMGASLGREGAPKQAGAVFANFFCDKDGTKDGTQDLCASGSICLHHNCYISCTGATDTTSCTKADKFPICKSVTTSSGAHFVCGSNTSLGSECDPTATPPKTCATGKVCIDGFCK